MKKIGLLIILSGFVLFTKAQVPSFPYSGNYSTGYGQNGVIGSKTGFVFPTSFADTTAVNSYQVSGSIVGFLKNVAGMIVRCGNDLWMRSTDLQYWSKISFSSVALSSLTAASATNTIDNTNYKQEWQWGTLSGTGLKLSTSSTAAAAAGLQRLLEINLRGANASASRQSYGIHLTNNHTGTNANNNGLYAAIDSAASGSAIYGYTGASMTGSGTTAVTAYSASTTGQAFNAQSFQTASDRYTAVINYNGTGNISGALSLVNGALLDATSGAITTYGLKSSLTGSRSGGSNDVINIAGYFSAINAQKNYAIVVPPSEGSVGIGTIAPATVLHVVGTTRIGSTSTQAMDLSTEYIGGSNNFPYGYLSVGAAGTAPSASLFQISPAYTGAKSPMVFSIANVGGSYTLNNRFSIAVPTEASGNPVVLFTEFAGGGTVWEDIAIGGGGTEATANLFVEANGRVGVGTNNITPTSTLHTNGSFSLGYRAISALRTLDITDYTVECTANTFTVTLPTAVGITGRIYFITNSGAGTITLGTTSSQTFVNVTATPTFLTLNTLTGVVVQSNGTNWLKVSSF